MHDDLSHVSNIMTDQADVTTMTSVSAERDHVDVMNLSEANNNLSLSDSPDVLFDHHHISLGLSDDASLSNLFEHCCSESDSESDSSFEAFNDHCVLNFDDPMSFLPDDVHDDNPDESHDATPPDDNDVSMNNSNDAANPPAVSNEQNVTDGTDAQQDVPTNLDDDTDQPCQGICNLCTKFGSACSSIMQTK